MEIKNVTRTLAGNITSLWKTTKAGASEKDTTQQDLMGEGSEASWNLGSQLFALTGKRGEKYKDYEEMDAEVVEISSALDIYADFVVSGGMETDETFTLDSETVPPKLKNVIENFEKQAQVKVKVWDIAREVSKMGDCFYEIVASPTNIIKLVKLPTRTMHYNFDDDKKLIEENPYCQKEYAEGEAIVEFAPWEVIHWKMGEGLYGVDEGVLAKLRRAYRVQRMLEDSLLVHRLTRAHQRLIYNIDVSGMGVTEAMTFLKKLKKLNSRRRFINQLGKLKEEENPLAPQGDLYQPVRKGGVGDIKVISSDMSISSIADIEHFHNKLFTGTKVPKAYLGFERDINAKATLVQQSLAFTKVVRRLRHVVASGIKKAYSLEFLLQGVDPDSFIWGIRFPGFGVADEELRWKIEQYKSTTIRNYVESGIKLSSEWVVRHIMFDLTKSEADQLIKLTDAGDVVAPSRYSMGAPAGTATGRIPDGGKKTSPTGNEHKIDMVALKTNVGNDSFLTRLQSDIQYELKNKRSRDEVY